MGAAKGGGRLIPYPSIYHWQGLSGNRSQVPITTYAGVKQIDTPRTMPPVMLAGGYQQLYTDIWSKVFALGCRGLALHNPFGAMWWGAGIVGPTDSCIMTWDAMQGAEQDQTLDGQFRPVLPVTVNRYELLRVLKQAPHGTQFMHYFGHPAMSTVLLRMRAAGMLQQWHDRAEESWWLPKQLRAHVAVDSFTGAANLTDLETTFLANVRAKVESWGRHFIAEEATATWKAGNIMPGLTNYDQALAFGRPPTTGYAFDQRELTGQALIDATQAVLALGWTPACNVLELAKAQGQTVN